MVDTGQNIQLKLIVKAFIVYIARRELGCKIFSSRTKISLNVVVLYLLYSVV